jgi:ABC-type glycerol-3-phosphate transport system substrate-binding protein
MSGEPRPKQFDHLALSRRRFLTTTLAAPPLTLALACGGQSPSSVSSSGGLQALRGALTYRTWWATLPSFDAWLNFIRKDWSQTYPNIALTIEPVGGADYLARFIADNAAGQVPDVMHASVAYVRGLWRDKMLSELNAYVAKAPEVAMEKFIPQALFYNQEEGKIFGMPHEGPAGHAIYYNVEQFQEAGLDPSYEAAKSLTWDSFLSAAKKLVRAVEGNIERSGFLLTMPSLSAGTFSAWLQTTGGSFYTPKVDKVAFDDGSGERVLQFLMDVQKANVSLPLSVPAAERNPNNLFYAGKVAMTERGLYMVNETVANAPDLKWDLMAYPKGPGPNGKRGTDVFCNMDVLPIQSRQKDLGFLWMTYYSSARIQGQRPIVASLPGVRKDFFDSPGWKEAVRKIPQNAHVQDVAATGGPYPFYRGAEIDREGAPLIAAVFAGQLSPKDAVRQIAEKANLILSGQLK